MALTEFLQPTYTIDSGDPSIEALIESRGWRPLEPVEQVRAIFHFVRDEIRHSVDAGTDDLPRTASETLRAGNGLCYAKSHLFAALARRLGVPTALRYQRLPLGDGFVLHGLNAVYLNEGWIDLDARGDRPGIATTFDLERGTYAFEDSASLDPRRFADTDPAVKDALGCLSLSELVQREYPSELTV